MQWLCTSGKTRCEIHYGMESAGHITGRLAGFTCSLSTFTGTEREMKPCVICPYLHNKEPKVAIFLASFLLWCVMSAPPPPPPVQLHLQGSYVSGAAQRQLHRSFAVQGLNVSPLQRETLCSAKASASPSMPLMHSVSEICLIAWGGCPAPERFRTLK